MNDPTRWSLDQDPPRDEALARLLREAEGPPAETGMDWERLHAAVMRRVAPATRPETGAPREWLDVVVQWRRVAAAASVSDGEVIHAGGWRRTTELAFRSARTASSSLIPMAAGPGAE